MEVYLDREWTSSLLYWKGIPGDAGIVTMLPLILHCAPKKISKCAIRLLERPPSTMTISDIEASAVTALLHKLKAASVIGLGQVLLFKDLMGGMRVQGREDILITVPKCFYLAVLPHQIGIIELAEKKIQVLSNSAARPWTTPMAFLNGRNAPFADAFLIFPELVIFIQDKQSVVARQQNATICETSKGSIPVDLDCLESERLNVSEAMMSDDLYLYVCDNQSDGEPCSIGTDTLLITVEHHAKLLGNTLAWLRASSML